ncbi:MAG: hypothetical protein KDA27_00775 [Candidatus Eisenbacteria bacterium]|uniref:DUF1565 domain-containing protein n=1 Tax=Eiseniibacteriota bacterium TaxID=2212470 RepID=A0A956NAZ1_UNCEI|nr:hypothetical protein [Candidatus Eisenbacteria bacterium]
MKPPASASVSALARTFASVSVSCFVSAFVSRALAFSLLGVAALAVFAPCARAATLVVDPDDGPYTTVGAALLAALDGDVIEISPGIYTESLEVTGKQVTLVGPSGSSVTTLDGGGLRILRMIDADVTLSGLTLRNGRARSGGAIAATDSDLTVDSCTFRNNAVYYGGIGSRSYGGAIFVCKDSRLEVRNASFIENVQETYRSGSAIAYTERDWAGNDSGGDPSDWDVRIRVERSSFLRNDQRIGGICHFDAAASATFDRCLFLGKGITTTTNWSASNCVYWEGESPQVTADEYPVESPLGSGPNWRNRSTLAEPVGSPIASPTLGARLSSATGVEADPRICPDDLERLHESSPAFSAYGGGIGATPLGCTSATILYASPARFVPNRSHRLDLYGYDLDLVDEARLVADDGTYVSSRDIVRTDCWSRTVFDLGLLPPGPRKLELMSGSFRVLSRDDIVFIDSVDPRRFRPAWIEANEAREIDLALGTATEDVDLELVGPDGATFAPTSLYASASDTLHMSLPALAAGVYGVRLRYPAGDTVDVEAMLRVGSPTPRHVPGEYATISEAVAAATPGDEIVVAAGTYPESVVLDRPVRIRGVSENVYDVRLLPPAGSRGIHVLEGAGHITEVAGLTIQDATIEGGPGAGILAETPVRVVDSMVFRCRSDGPNAVGAGIWAAPGSEVVSTTLQANVASSDWVSTPDPTREASGGTAGGIYGVGCRVEKCALRGNSAMSCAAAVVDGIFQGNEVESGSSSGERGAIHACALRGIARGNRFDHGCGSVRPYAVFLGPSEVDHNTFTDFWLDLCEYLSILQIQGPVDFHHNSLAGVRLMVCRQHQPADESEGWIRVTENLIESNDAGPPQLQYCEDRLSSSPAVEVPLSRVEFVFNLGYPITMYGFGGLDDCGSCVIPMESVGYCEVRRHDGYDSYGQFDLRLEETSPALPGNSPFPPDTLGAITEVCPAVNPVFLEFTRLDRTSEGVLLEWSFVSDVEIIGVGIERRELRTDAVTERVDSGWLPPCHQCSFLDESALPGEPYAYSAVVLYPGGATERIDLGEIEGGAPTKLELGAPWPNPSGAQFSSWFQVPVEADVVIELVGPSGRRVETLWDGPAAAGRHTVERPVGAAPLPSGVYWLKLRTTAGDRASQRLVVIR